MIHERQMKNAQLFILKMSIVLIDTILFAVVWYNYYRNEMGRYMFYRRGDFVLCILYLCIFAIMVKLYGGIELRTSRITELIYSQIIAAFISNAIIYIVIILLTRRLSGILPLLFVTFSECLVGVGWSYFANRITNIIFKPAKVLIVYDNEEAYRNGKAIIDKLSWRFRYAGEIKLFGKNVTESFNQEIEKFVDAMVTTESDCVMLCGLISSQRNDIIKYCVEHDIKAYVRPNIGDFIISHAQVIQMANLPVVICERVTQGIIYSVLKRMVDILVALIGLIVSGPFLIITAIAIKLYDGGPVFYKQVRLTKNGKEFNILKFRSMKVDAESDGVARLSTENDDRITPVGKIIRAYRIDELPQLINILKGDLSCVGPRPERPEIAEQYVEKMPEFSLRLQVKAGLTGYAQVYGKYNTEPYDKLQMDLLYITKMSLVNDIKIMFATIKILFMSESTEGIENGMTNAMGEKKMLVSVIMPTYNCGKYIAQSIESVIHQTYTDWEIQIVDDCSTDDTSKVVKKYMDMYPNIHYYKLKYNGGADVARTEAMKRAKGKYIAFLDSDDLWHPEKLEKQINFMKKTGAKFCATGYSWIDIEGKQLNTAFIPPYKTDYKKMIRLSNPIGNLTVMYDKEALGIFEVPHIKKRNDFALWLKILKKTDYCFGMDEILGRYRVGRVDSISRNKLSQIKYHWELYHEIECHSVIRSFYEVMCWAFVKGTGMGINKIKVNRRDL